MDELTPISCPACDGSGRTRRFRLMPLLVALTAMLFIVLGELLRHALKPGPAGVTVDSAFLGLALGFVYLVFVGSLIVSFRRGHCPECRGQGTRGNMPRESLLTRRDDQPLLQHGKCRECGYELTGNVSGRCPECGRSVPPT
jgi:hypothetical protein